jgi:hypothetical protein
MCARSSLYVFAADVPLDFRWAYVPGSEIYASSKDEFFVFRRHFEEF